MDGGNWERALRNMMGPKSGGVSRSPSPGTTGNIAYAPGMMDYTSRPGTPSTKALQMAAGNPYQPGTSSPGSSTGGPPTGRPSQPTVGGGMDPRMAQMMMQRIMAAIDRNVARQGRLRAPTV